MTAPGVAAAPEGSHGDPASHGDHAPEPLTGAADRPAISGSMSERAADVRLEGVTKRFGSFVAVDRMELEIRRGAFYSLLGPSGCGKTTTLRMIAGFEQPTEGEVYIGGQPVAGVPPFRRNVNTVFQHYALFPHMDVARNVGYGLRQRGIKGDEERRRVDEALELVRLEGHGKRRTWELSGGQQQRVALARALVNHPTVLLLDEPLGALDMKLRKEMQLELKSLQHRVGITFVYVTHDQEEAITMSDVVVVMRDGRIQQQGAPKDLYERPANRFVAGFLGLSNFMSGRLTTAGQVGEEVEVDLGGVARVRGHLTDPQVRPSVGDEVTVAVRPERLWLGPVDASGLASVSVAAGATRLEGRVSQATYLGDQIEYRIETPVGELVARRQNSEGGGAVTGVGPGDPVTVGWRDDANLILAS
jgi:spermidine/putrescine transport system ATP-binding protein